MVTPDKQEPKEAPAGAPPGATPTPQPEASSVDPNVLGTTEDYQLIRAYDLIKGVSLFGNRVGN